MGYKVPVGVSNKHLHLAKTELEALFGQGYELSFKKELKQPGQFAAEEQVEVVGPKGSAKLRVLGPLRPETQIELSMTDARSLGIKAPVRESGKLDGTPGCKLVGPKGEIEVSKGCICALRHIHLSAEQAEEAGVSDKEFVSVKVGGERALIFEQVLIRSGAGHFREMHIDTDEANAAGIGNDAEVEILK